MLLVRDEDLLVDVLDPLTDALLLKEWTHA